MIAEGLESVRWLFPIFKRPWGVTVDKEISFLIFCLSHDLLIAKLESYGLDDGSLNFLLDSRKYKTKVGSSYSKWSEICQGITQGSILGPLLFHISINGIFFFVE